MAKLTRPFTKGVMHGDSDLYTIIQSLLPLLNGKLVNVTDYGAKCDGVTDDSEALQLAVNENKTLVFPPNVSISVSKTIKLQRDSRLIGFNTKLIGAQGIAILELPRFNGVVTGTEISGFHFAGYNCIGLSVSNEGLGDGQGYYRYVPRLNMKHCEFYGELLYGVSANLIFSHFEHCSFGYLVSDGFQKQIKGIRSHYTDGEPNNSNFNLVEYCYFYGNEIAIDARGGKHWVVRMCDFEQGKQCMIFDKIDSIKIEDFWIESCQGTEGVIKITNCKGSAIIDFGMLYRSGGADGGMITYDAATVNSIRVTNMLGEGQGPSVLLNKNKLGTSQAIKIPEQNNVIWYNNNFEGSIMEGTAYTNSYSYHGKGTPRFSARFNFAAGTVTNSSSQVKLIRQATGSYVIEVANGFGVTDTSTLVPVVTAYNAYVRIASTGRANQLLINTYDGSTHQLVDSQDVSLIVI